MTQFAELIRTLSLSGVDFIIVGGVAAAAHGSPRATQDIDVVYSRAPDNLSRIAEALQNCDVYLRGAFRRVCHSGSTQRRSRPD